MIDRRGTVRITDFGLAITAGEVRSEDAWAGTPAWMAPEQLAGAKPTRQSDIYALGLVLYELLTGKDAFPGKNLDEIVRQRQKGAPPKISSVVKDVDPGVERMILNCLQKEPDSRPRTVLEVSGALPGGDPLAAAIAAGETPSPEMVAAAADPPLIPVGWLWFFALVIIVGWVVIGFLLQVGSVLAFTPLKSPEVMAEHAKQIIARLGYTDRWIFVGHALFVENSADAAVLSDVRALSDAIAKSFSGWLPAWEATMRGES